jgi:hypothetical protein
MVDIDKDIAKSLTKYEVRQLECILNAIENSEYYGSGLSHINGAYVEVEVTDLLLDEDQDDDDVLFDIVEISLESGEQDMGDGHSSCNTSKCHISRRYLGDEKMGLEEKMRKVTD